MPIRVLIVDDHGVVRAGLNSLLSAEAEIEVVGEARDGNEAMRLARELQPDVVLLDISMPGPSGIDVTRQLREELPTARVLILTIYEDEGLVRAALRAGAAGYVPKRAIASELINAILAVSNGYGYVHPTMTRALVPGLKSSLVGDASLIAFLTPRERKVLSLIAQGYTNGEIAELLVISPRAVERHRAQVMGKLDLHSRADLVRFAREHSLF